jgi:hypothetical protein
MSDKELYNNLENARNDLENLLKPRPRGDSCSRYVLEVLKDKKVQEAFVGHINNDEAFQGFSCYPFAIEGIMVVFTFQCKPPRICIVAPAFAAHYDLGTKTVTGITDPYIPVT